MDSVKCGSVKWYSYKTPFSLIEKCYNMEFTIEYSGSRILIFLIFWGLANLINGLFCKLASFCSRKGCNLVLYDNHPFLFTYDLTKHEYEDQLGNLQKTPDYNTSNPRVLELVNEQKLSSQFSNAIIDFKTAKADRAVRNIKKKLKVKEYLDIKMFQSV